MVRLMIRVDADVPDGALTAFPALVPMRHPPQTTLTGPVEDSEELQGILNHLTQLGLAIVEVVTIPDPTPQAGRTRPGEG